MYPTYDAWRAAFDAAPVYVQWDTERSITGDAVGHYSLQVGVSRHMSHEFVDDWIVSISDMTERVTKLRGLVRARRLDRAKALVPAERAYEVPDEVARRCS
jgi:hypothetical protein